MRAAAAGRGGWNREISQQNPLLERVIALAEDQLQSLGTAGAGDGDDLEDDSRSRSYGGYTDAAGGHRSGRYGARWGALSKEEIKALHRELSVLRRNALEREGSLSSVMADAIKTETELRAQAAKAVDALEDAEVRHAKQSRESQANLAELR